MGRSHHSGIRAAFGIGLRNGGRKVISWKRCSKDSKGRIERGD